MEHPIEKYLDKDEFVQQVYDLLYNALIVRGEYDEEEMNIVQAYCDAILKWAGEKPGKYHLPFLGEGEDAEVYWLNSDKKKILKLTMDKSDAHACQILAKKPDKSLLKVYKVVDVCHGGSDWGYAILAEKLTPLSGSMRKYLEKALLGLKMMSSLPRHGVTKPWIVEVKHALNVFKDDPRAQKYVDDVVNVFPILEAWANALTDRGIAWTDFHLGNIMMRRHDPVIVDFGRSRVYRGSIPKLQVSLPEK